MPLSADLAGKSVQAAVAIIKAKWVLDHGEAIESVYELIVDGHGNKLPKTNRSGNALSHSASYLIARLVEDKTPV